MRYKLLLIFFCIFTASVYSQNIVSISKSDEGRTINLSTNQVLEIKLPCQPSTGYGWYILSINKELIKQTGNWDFIPDESNYLVGQTGTEIIRFTGVSKGTTELKLEYRRPWETHKPAFDNYVVTLNSEGKYNGIYTPTIKSYKIKSSNLSPDLSGFQTSNPNHPLPKAALPGTFSWQSQCTPVKDQAQCGSCWAFASVGSFEAIINIKDNNVRNLSEQWLINCSGNNGCQGGGCPNDMWVSPGAVYDIDLPYADASCGMVSGSSASCIGTCGSSYTYHEQAQSTYYVNGSSPSVAQIKQAIYSYGPVWVTIDAGNNFQAYTGGVFTTTDGTVIDHAVVLVGWKDSTALSGGGYWMLRNSWGNWWGEHGYMRIEYGVSVVGTDAAYIVYKGGLSSCTGTPNPGNTVSSSPSQVCSTDVFTLSLQNFSGTGVTYQWQTSPDNGTWSNVSGSTNATYITSQSVSTWYRCAVNCSGNTGNSSPMQITMSSVCYCLGSYTNCGSPDGINITDVIFGSIENATPPYCNSTTNSTDFISYTALSTSVTQGLSYPISVTCDDLDNYPVYWGIWVDWNNSGSFTDNANKYTAINNNSGTSLTGTGTVLVPSNATAGNHRMRIRANYNSNPGQANVCSTLGYGEQQDYTVNVLSSIPCSGTPNPGNTISSANPVCTISVFTLSLQNTVPGSGITYQWQTSTDNATWSNISNANDNSYDASQTVSTYYRCEVTCSGNTGTLASLQITMNTPCNCAGNTVSSFTASKTSFCALPATVNFTNTSTGGETYSWYFGDGSASGLSNPSHIYNKSGSYTVSLVTTNICKKDSIAKSSFIIVSLPTSPQTTSQVNINCGTSASLSATGFGTLKWYTQATGGTSIATGTGYNTPVLYDTTNYYVENDVISYVYNTPTNDNFGTGGYFDNSTSRYNTFDVYKPCTLISVDAYAQNTGNRTITLWDSNLNTLNSITTNMTTGKNTITLNFPLKAGTNYALGIKGTANLYRNITGAAFPYTDPNNYVSITGNNVPDTVHYYYFYHWDLAEDTCISDRTPVEVDVNSNLPVSVSITSNPQGAICKGTSVTYSASPVNGGSNPAYQWKVNGINAGINSSVYTYAPSNNDTVSCILTSDAICTTGNPASSNTIIMTVNDNLPVSVNIGASTNNICSGASVTFTTTSTNEGTNPKYQWQINGENVGTNSSAYTYNPLNKDSLTCVLTSDAACIAGNPATSNPIIMIVNDNLPVSVNIDVSANNICSGTSVTFTANATNGGANPAYQWQVNGVNAGSDNSSFTYPPSDKDSVTCILSSNETCISGSPATSNQVQMIVYTTPDAPAPGSNSPQCTGSTLELSATDNQPTATYIWTGPNSFSSDLQNPILSDITTAASGTYYVQSVLNGCTSQSDSTTVNVISNVKPVITDTISNQAICSGNNVTFTFKTTGTELSYQWSKGGKDIPDATNSAYSLSDVSALMSDVYSCNISNTCGSAQLPEFNLTVNLPPASNVIFVKQIKYTGDSISYTLSPEGTEPFTYQWLRNGDLLSGETNRTFNIFSIACSDTGTYSCSIGNSCDTIIAKIAQLFVSNCNINGGNKISGYVNYENADSTIMTNTTVYLTNSEDSIITNTKTDSTGYYTFLNLQNGTYKLSCSTTKDWGGVNPIDALIVNRTYIGLYKLADPLKLLAADINNDGKINPIDALLINRRYISLIHKFTISDWLFSNPTVNIDGSDITKNISSLCAGDVNGSYSPPARVINSQLSVNSNKSININNNVLFDIPIYLNDNIELGAIGLKLKLNTEYCKLIAVKSVIDGLIYNITDDGVVIAWSAEYQGYNITPDKPLFYITVICESVANSNFQISSESVLADIEGNYISTDKLFMPKLIFNIQHSAFNIQIYPNPFSNITNINYSITRDANVEFDLFNVLGEKIAVLINESQIAGNHTLQYDASNLKQGIYYLKSQVSSINYQFSKSNILVITR